MQSHFKTIFLKEVVLNQYDKAEVERKRKEGKRDG